MQAGEASERAVVNVIMAGRDEAFEERMRPVGLALEFGMELAGEEKRVFFDLDHFHEFAVG